MADLTLYHASPSRSSIVLWMLEELGQPSDIHLISLSRVLRARHDDTGDLGALTESVSAGRGALAGTPLAHTEWAGIASSLSNALVALHSEPPSRLRPASFGNVASEM